MNFQFEGMNAVGLLVSGNLEADSHEDAVQLVRERGIYPTRLYPSRSSIMSEITSDGDMEMPSQTNPKPGIMPTYVYMALWMFGIACVSAGLIGSIYVSIRYAIDTWSATCHWTPRGLLAVGFVVAGFYCIGKTTEKKT